MSEFGQFTWKALGFSIKKFPNFYYVFPIYNSKSHDICSNSNIVHAPFNTSFNLMPCHKFDSSLSEKKYRRLDAEGEM